MSTDNGNMEQAIWVRAPKGLIEKLDKIAEAWNGDPRKGKVNRSRVIRAALTEWTERELSVQASNGKNKILVEIDDDLMAGLVSGANNCCAGNIDRAVIEALELWIPE
jgi:hypothetical protein